MRKRDVKVFGGDPTPIQKSLPAEPASLETELVVVQVTKLEAAREHVPQVRVRLWTLTWAEANSQSK
jgi:hypothetical protein